MEKLYNKYRFKDFKSIVGNPPYAQKLQSDIGGTKIDHAYLLWSSTPGVGKTSMARILASSIPNAYVEEVNASLNNGVDKGKEIAEHAKDMAIGYKNKVIIINEPMRATGNFFNALLEVIEETGENLYFIITTTDINKIPANIRSRFTKIEFTTPDLKSIRNHLAFICKEEGITTERSVLTKICEINNNVPRDCISSLELLVGVSDTQTQLKLIGESQTQETAVGYEIAKLLSKKSTQWKDVSTLLKDVKDNEVEGIRRTVLSYHTSILLNNGSKDSALVLDSFSKEMYDSPKASLVLACYENI